MERPFELALTVVSEIMKSVLLKSIIGRAKIGVTWMERSFELRITVVSEIMKSFLLKKQYT